MNKENRVGKILESYSGNTKLRATINLIPYIGGALDVLISSNVQNKTVERIERLFDGLKFKLETIEEKQIDFQYLESEEFYDLLLKAINASVKTRLDDKIMAYSEILKNAIIRNSEETLSHEDVLDMIEQLTANDVIHIKNLTEYLDNTSRQKNKEIGRVDINAGAINQIFSDLTLDYIFVGLLRLENHNLISRRPNISGVEIRSYHFLSTPILRILIDFLRK
jgi:hypothetical protein